MNTKQDDLNPNTLPLEKVVEQIDSKVLAYYLEQVSMFLKNSKKDLLFPKLSPYLDAFLVRFISNVQNMEDLLDTFDWNSRSFAEDIIDSLIENENVYKLTYSYENSRIESDILVYKKVYLEKDKKNLEKGSKQCVNSDALYASQNNSTKLPDEQESPRKDLSWVNATLKFIKDDTRTLLQYPTMSYQEADVVYSVVKQQCKDVTQFGPLCEDLLEAIKVLNETVELKTSFLYVNSKEVQLCIEKCLLKSNSVKCKLQPPLKNNSKVQEKTDLNQSNTSDTKSKTKVEKADTKSKRKVEKVFSNRKQLVDSLSKAFINTTLKTILNFIRTESEASLVFKNADEKQLSFIQSACAMARTPRFYTLFADDSRQILREIAKVITENQWYELRVDVAKAQKDKLRTVSFVKHPKESYDEERKNTNKSITFESGGKLEQVVGGIVGGILTVNKENQPLKSTDIETRIEPNENKSITNGKEPQIKEDIQNSDKENIVPPSNETEIKKDNVTEVKPQTRPSRADYKDQNSSSDMKRAKSVPPSLIERDKKVGEILGGRKLCTSKLKMLQAMSIPMESDIATRMMNQMGWDGGPLGLRGEGITEPIIPPLHLAPKAGLGHVKPDKKSNSIFRLNFLQQLLTLLTIEQSKLIIEYKTLITDQENKYITNTMKLLNDRKNLSENDEEIKSVVYGIMEELLCDPDLEISFGISSDKKYVTLIKNITTFKKKTIPPTEDRDAIIMQMCSNLPKIITTDCTKNIGLYYMKSSSTLKMGLRIVLRYKVMEFLKSNLMEYTIEFNFDLPKKSVNGFKNTMNVINERKKEIFTTSIEREMNTETLRHAKGIQICVQTDEQRFFTLRKKIVKLPPNSKELSDLANNNSSIVYKNLIIETKQQSNTKQESNATQESKTKQVSNATQESKTKQVSNATQESKTSQVAFAQEASKNASNITDDMKNGTVNSTDTVEVDYIFISDDKIVIVDNENEAQSNSLELKEMEQEIQSIENLSPSIKRNRSDSASSHNIIKKTKMTESVTYFFITPKDGDKITNDEIRKFQTAVAEQIDLATNLPMLECHGVANGAIVYGCHNDIGAKLIKSVASEMQLTTKESENFGENGFHKLNIRFNSFVGVNLKKLFNLIECYNIGLNTDRWAVEDVEVFIDYIILSVEVDYASFKYILEANFRLFAGTDRLRISLVWD